MHQRVVVAVLIADLTEDVAAGVLRLQIFAMHVGHVEKAARHAVIGLVEVFARAASATVIACASDEKASGVPRKMLRGS